MKDKSWASEVAGDVILQLLNDRSIRSITKFLGRDSITRVSMITFAGKRESVRARTQNAYVTIGQPNYLERRWIKKHKHLAVVPPLVKKVKVA